VRRSRKSIAQNVQGKKRLVSRKKGVSDASTLERSQARRFDDKEIEKKSFSVSSAHAALAWENTKRKPEKNATGSLLLK